MGLPEPQDVVGEWMAKLTTDELKERFKFFDGKEGYDRGETSVYAYQAARLREEILRREDT